MNSKRRAVISHAITHLQAAQEIVSNVLDEEQEALDNIPENLEATERYEKIENAVDALNDASDSIDSALSALDDAKA